MLRSTTAKVTMTAGVVAAGALAVAFFMSRRKSKRTKIIDMMQVFQKKHVHIRDPEKVEEKVTQLIRDGRNKLQVVSDFDRTITRFMHNGRKIPTCHGVLDECKMLPESYREAACKLRSKYYPLEVDGKLTVDEKYNLMVEWWTSAHNLLVSCGLNRADIKDMVAKSGVMLRDGVTEMFRRCDDAGVPLLVFSAGVGDILSEAISQFSQFFPNMQVISNLMDFDDEDKLVGFKGELIHTYNKHEVAQHHPEYFESIMHRTNVILLGDMLGDLKMADGMPQAQTVLSIGFLNDHIEANLEDYKAKYDIVLVSDETFDLANALLQKIL
ncbi:cytosolic 5'-nucleotidase 3-like [Diadema antillarum]|uniref:cytosolic 5'-nucleotidase 3-like n=1 Tax=Diadema antillarum TaxID=105358 RepID=UPI003A855F8E